MFNFSKNHFGSYRDIINKFESWASQGDSMAKEMDIEPVTVSGAIKSLGIVLVLCLIALLVILGIEFLFFWEMDFIKWFAMVSEAVVFIGIVLLAAAIIIGIYLWIIVRLNGQTPDEYLNELLDSLNEQK